MRLVLFVFFPVLILIPTDAWAWGPVTHTSYGLDIINHLSLLAPAMQEILTKFRWDFLYGCVAADILIKKDAVPYDQNCHNWDIGLLVLEKSVDPRQKAFAYGYLSHLAADAISHNMLVHKTKHLRHFCRELSVDIHQPKKNQKLVKELSSTFHGSIHDELLEETLEKTLFKFETNKKIFNSLVKMTTTYKVLKPFFAVHYKTLNQKFESDLRKISLHASTDILNNMKSADVYKMDPCGKRTPKEALIPLKKWALAS